MALLTLSDIRTSFHTRRGIVRAVRGVSLSVDAGETLGIVGESGCGKSVLCATTMGLLPVPPARVEGGSAVFDGRDLLHCSAGEMRRVRGREIAMIFQDPMTSLNPYLRIDIQVMEPLLTHELIGKREARARAIEALARVGIADAARILRAYPHELSGGMRQRVMIASALITHPRLLIADEPTTALDVTVQAQILDLIRRLRSDEGMGMILVTHNLAVAAQTCSRIAVMYAGVVVETAPVSMIFGSPAHPYTCALQRSIPAGVSRGAPLQSIGGQPPDLVSPPPGCPFTPRCSYAGPFCSKAPLTLGERRPGHATACVRVLNGEVTLP